VLTPYAVIGNPVAHSLSPVIHHYFAKQHNVALSYSTIQGDDVLFEQQITEFFNNQGRGLNVTLPFKKRAFALASVHTPRCQQARAANTLWYQNGVLHADNTDGIGLVTDLLRYCAVSALKILIVGAGGAACGIIPSLLAMQPKTLCLMNRSVASLVAIQAAFPQVECLPWHNVKDHFDLIINATASEMSSSPVEWPPVLLAARPFCYDLNYQLSQDTAFVRYARAHQCEATDGLGMLIEQAAAAFAQWHKIQPETKLLVSSRLACAGK